MKYIAISYAQAIYEIKLNNMCAANLRIIRYKTIINKHINRFHISHLKKNYSKSFIDLTSIMISFFDFNANDATFIDELYLSLGKIIKQLHVYRQQHDFFFLPLESISRCKAYIFIFNRDIIRRCFVDFSRNAFKHVLSIDELKKIICYFIFKFRVGV